MVKLLAESEGGFLVGAFGLVVGIIIVSATISNRRETGERLNQIATRMGLGFQMGGLFELPTLTGSVDGNVGRLTFAEGKQEHTLLALRVPAYRGGSLSIQSETFGGLFWVNDLRIRDRRFDEDFIVQA